MATAAQVVVSPLFANNTGITNCATEITVGQVIDKFISEVPGGKLKQTVDTLKSGSLDMKVTGIVTTMFATVEVIQKTIALGANFIIAHEPTFYSHQDSTDWLEKTLPTSIRRHY